jgi:hypothetical protein
VQIQLQRQDYLAERAEMSDEDLASGRDGGRKAAPMMAQFDIAEHMPHSRDETN